MSAPSVSIVMPTRNGMATLPAVFGALTSQRYDGTIEIIAVDSASTDGTAEWLRPRVGQLISITSESFNHGRTRNLGVEHSHGELIVLLVQDAVPASETWLAELTAPLIHDHRVAGAFARQRLRDSASAVTRAYATHLATSEQGRTVALCRTELMSLLPLDRLDRCTFDNVCSCIRRAVWLEHPFPETPIAEDVEWALSVLLAGHRIAYAPRATVIHSHERSARYEFARTYQLHRRLYELFELRTIPSAWTLAHAVSSCLIRHIQCERVTPLNARKASRLARAVALAFAWPSGQYFGAASAARDAKPPRWKSV